VPQVHQQERLHPGTLSFPPPTPTRSYWSYGKRSGY
jgi:hypothetical protein